MKQKPQLRPTATTLATNAGRALRRAAVVARKTARRYGTPIYYVQDGKVVSARP
jgi:hypothetical protein